MKEEFKIIIDQLKSLSLLDISELIKSIEITFGIDSSQNFVSNQQQNQVVSLPAVAIEEKTSFEITLTEVPADKKIAILKLVRSITGLGLKESKEIVDNVPKLLKEGITKEESESIKKDIEILGGKVLIK